MPPLAILAEIRKLSAPPPGGFAPADGALALSLLIPARQAGHALENTVSQAHAYLERRWPGAFEIILIPNPASPADRSIELSQALAQRLPGVRVVVHLTPRGKGAALRSGVQAARGGAVFFTDADLPYDLGFIQTAMERLEGGSDLVTGNRRLKESEFDLPVGLLPLAYGRHRLGLAFNRLVRLLLPIHTTDTQAGLKGMSRRLALEAFGRQSCPGFFFDLEIFLTAAGLAWRVEEVPVTLYLNSEKSTVRILRECLLAGFWLARIWLRSLRGAYRISRPPVLRRYRGASLGTRLFLFLRWHLTPYRVMASYLPRAGHVLDLGCGHGLFAVAAAEGSSERRVFGIDHDAERIRLAREAARGIDNLEFDAGGLQDCAAALPLAAVSMIDVMHYFTPDQQRALIQDAHRRLAPGGVLLVREVDPHGGLASRWNRLYERLATGIGFTRAKEAGLHFRSPAGWRALLAECGFAADSRPCSHFLFADVLFIGKKGKPR